MRVLETMKRRNVAIGVGIVVYCIGYVGLIGIELLNGVDEPREVVSILLATGILIVLLSVFYFYVWIDGYLGHAQ